MLQISSVGIEAAIGATPAVSRDQLLHQLASLTTPPDLYSSLRALTQYVGASHYLLARCDVLQDNGLDFVLTSDWPFYIVKRLTVESAATYARTSELEKCLQLFQPGFALLPDDLILPDGTSRQYCAMTFNIGRTRLTLMLLFREGFILSADRLRDVGLLAGYCVSFRQYSEGRSERDFELTDRELECLFWIAEGKTSDEIGVILGISRNTINNYITSVMRKTATKTRSEAIAFAVRNNLV
ncbi:transcriptional regulator VisN [Rhizobium sp. RAF56]|jgi:DNA-binding CsgD family transcriptional regulator|uniref:transcriptional regulator VisN n=1 Tax=Rhizobium sp. RAF56 TaxID=3233062 RepID=UPI003F9AD344